jgi:hypothetical protein
LHAIGEPPRQISNESFRRSAASLSAAPVCSTVRRAGHSGAVLIQ